jgi:uncharacterized membrane protein HdeD (DUF308 family)
MVDTPNRGFGLLVLRGICAILFGVLAFLLPGITLASLVLLFGAYALVNGVLSIVMAVGAPKGSPGRATTAILGVLGVATGILTFFYPGVTALSLVLLIAWWAILTGAFEIAAAIRFRRILKREWVLVVSGLLSILFGILLIARPGAGALSLIWLIGGYAIVFGVLLLTSAFYLKNALSSLRPAAGVA